jgi:hypothetical protein
VAVSGPVEEVHVERLSLRVAGLDEDAARVLSRLVAEGLAPVLGRASAGTGLDHLQVEVVPAEPGSAGIAGAGGGASPEELAARIVERIGRVLARDRAFGPLGEEGTL